jgi:hypothetical protein
LSGPRKLSPLVALRPAIWLVLIALTGCAMLTRAPTDDPRPAPGSESAAETESEPATAVLPQVQEPTIAVVLSKDTVAYAAVADALDSSLARPWVRYEINDQNSESVLRDVRAGGHSAGIAIGRQALTLLGQTALPVAYCQVLQPSTGEKTRRGVAPLPTFESQLDAWREVQPGLATIGIITGPGLDDAPAVLTLAAQQRGLGVRHAAARSDREMLHLFQRMVPEIQGYLLYPDPRILSPRTLRDLLAYANKHGIWVLTYNRPIFDLGATLLVSADPMEIAEQVVAALEAPGAGALTLPLQRTLMEHRGAERALPPVAEGAP